MIDNDTIIQLTPKTDYQTVKKKYKEIGQYDEFKSYIKLTKNQDLRNLLYIRQRGNCALCNGIMRLNSDDCVIHHVNYDCACHSNDKPIKIFCPQPNGYLWTEVPPCHSCFYLEPKKFDLCACSKNIVLVHVKCHDIIHNINK